MKLYEHYIEFDTWADCDGSHIFNYSVSIWKGVEEKPKSFYGTICTWNDKVCKPYKIINKNQYQTILVDNKSCARIRIGFRYWDNKDIGKEAMKEMVINYLLEQIDLIA